MKSIQSIIFFAFLLPCFSLADVIPADRLIDWSKSGVTGGIPDRQTIDTTLSSTATAAQINSALSSCPADQVVFLSAGTYSLAATINIPSHKVLRGAGPDATILLFTADLAQNVYLNGGYSDMGWTSPVNITSGYTKGSSQLVLADATGFTSTSFVYISELNDATIPVVITNTNGTCNYCGIYGSNGTRARFQLSAVTAVSGNTITIDPPMFFTFSSANAPQALKAPSTYVQFAGIEDLTIKNSGTGFTNTRKGITFQGAANSWVRNVTIDNYGKRGIDLWFDVFRNEIRECTFTNGHDQVNSDNYAVQIENGTGNLIENNIFASTANGIILVSSSGNVFGYNYMHGVHRTASMDTWFWPDTWTHGAHSSYNLWEGNDETALEWDYYWGSNSHDMAFRNRFRGKDETITYDLANVQTGGAILDYPDNNYMSALGNVLGTSGFQNKYEETVYQAVSRPVWATVRSAFGKTSDLGYTTMLRHMNFDYFTNSIKHCGDAGEPACQGGDAGTALPVSLYRTAKPLWFGAVAWPPIGPDVTGYTNKIPAQVRFEGGAGVSSPRQFKISTVSPMFFNQAASSIEYQVTEPGLVKLEMFDVSGKLLRTLVEKNCNPGIYSISIGSISFTTDKVMLFRLTTGRRSSSVKVMPFTDRIMR